MVIMLLICGAVLSQETTVRFIGQLNGTDYCRLDSVVVTNLTRNWSETVEYPDTIIVLGSTVEANMNITTTQGLGQNIPNPFNCETRVELSVSQREDVRMQLLDVAGKSYAEYNGSLDVGVHTFNISAANPQTYLFNAIIGDSQYSIRMVNVGSGCGYSIKYVGVWGGIETKLTTVNEFQIGDNMRYVGYATIDGELIESVAIEQSQVVNQYITLNFIHLSRPGVETINATNITHSTATLRGNVTNDGGAPIISCGFYYGTSEDNLSQNVVASINGSMFSCDISGLSLNTTYYYKAYAINSEGTAIGNVVTFTTEQIGVPIVSTDPATNITAMSAILNGSIVFDGGNEITECGFYYGTSEDNLSYNVSAIISDNMFSSTINGLTQGTTYYYKAYATNGERIAIGEIVSFSTHECECGGSVTVTDIDGNTYSTVQIGNQCWMAENLRTTKFADGTSISLAISSNGSASVAYRYYPNSNSDNVLRYGYLYNRKAATKGTNSSANPSGVQGVCPNGWHLPSHAELKQL